MKYYYYVQSDGCVIRQTEGEKESIGTGSFSPPNHHTPSTLPPHSYHLLDLLLMLNAPHCWSLFFPLRHSHSTSLSFVSLFKFSFLPFLVVVVEPLRRLPFPLPISLLTPFTIPFIRKPLVHHVVFHSSPDR